MPQFPGQPASATNTDNSKGIAAGETWTVDELEKTVGGFLGNGDRHSFAVGNDLKL